MKEEQSIIKTIARNGVKCDRCKKRQVVIILGNERLCHFCFQFMNKPSNDDKQRLNHLEKLLWHCPHARITFNADPDAEIPIGYSIRVEGCETTEVAAPSIRECIDLDIQQAIARGGTAPWHDGWSKEPPKESGTYWHWNGDPYSMPIHLEIMWSGHTNSCFAPASQWGWTEAQNVEDMGGWWMPLHTPLPPREQ